MGENDGSDNKGKGKGKSRHVDNACADVCKEGECDSEEDGTKPECAACAKCEAAQSEDESEGDAEGDGEGEEGGSEGSDGKGNGKGKMEKMREKRERQAR